MKNPYFNAYLAKVLNLCKTMVVKIEDLAEAVNTEVGYTSNVSNLKHTWKYYMNLAGEYHFTDTPMTVISLDTLQEIPFTKQSLEINLSTKAAFSYGSRYYKALVERYPKQETLIKGILNPVDIQTAINAPEGTILFYDKNYVEEQEISLIPNLERWIKSVLGRWNVTGYKRIAEYYTASRVAVLFAMMPTEILNLRKEACGTNEVHSFHITERLASIGRMDKYLPQMTLKQKLFLYRNLNYLIRNAGKQETFDLLLQRIITERNLPLARYDMHHRLDNLLEDLVPRVEMRRVRLNSHPGDGSDPNRSLEYVMGKQIDVARSNRSVLDNELDQHVERFQHSLTNTLKTKVFESALLDTTNNVVYNLDEVVLNHWAYLAAKGRLGFFMTVVNPYNGFRYQLIAKDALVLYLYAYYKARGATFHKVPDFLATGVLKEVRPTETELLNEVGEYVDLQGIRSIMEGIPSVGEYTSIVSFQQFLNSVYLFKNFQLVPVARTENSLERAYRDIVAARCYKEEEVTFYNDLTMEDWLNERDIDLDALSSSDLNLLASSIIDEISGGAIGNRSTALSDIQRSMLGIMRDLSSYSVQYIRTINSSNFRLANVLGVRGYNPGNYFKTKEEVTLANTGDASLKSKPRTKAKTNLKPQVQNGTQSKVRTAVDVDVDINFKEHSSSSNVIYASIGCVDFNVVV